MYLLVELTKPILQEIAKATVVKISDFTPDTIDNLMLMDGTGFLLMDGSSLALEEQS